MGKVEKKEKVFELHELGYSYQNIADELGLSKSTVSRWITEQNETESFDDNLELQGFEVPEPKKKVGLSGAEILAIESQKFQSNLKLMERKHQLEQEQKDKEHKRKMELIQMEKNEKLEKERQQRKQDQAERMTNLNKAIFDFSENYVDADGVEDMPTKELKKMILMGKKILFSIEEVGEKFGLSTKQISQISHHKAMSSIVEDLENTIEDYKETTVDFEADEETLETVQEFLESAETLQQAFNQTKKQLKGY